VLIPLCSKQKALYKECLCDSSVIIIISQPTSGCCSIEHISRHLREIYTSTGTLLSNVAEECSPLIVLWPLGIICLHGKKVSWHYKMKVLDQFSHKNVDGAEAGFLIFTFDDLMFGPTKALFAYITLHSWRPQPWLRSGFSLTPPNPPSLQPHRPRFSPPSPTIVFLSLNMITHIPMCMLQPWLGAVRRS
jgi:hypothetical protein